MVNWPDFWTYHGDARDGSQYPSEINLLWTDPPFGTGKVMRGESAEYKDHSDTEYVLEAMSAWLPSMHENGVVVVCCDYRLAPSMTHHMTEGEDWAYRGEIIWTFGLGRPRTSWWPVRHNNLLTFTSTKENGVFFSEHMPREIRRAPKEGYPDDKPAGSVWDLTFSNTNSERVGYPNQKPLNIIEPFVDCHTTPGMTVADPFMGSGSVGIAAAARGCHFIGADTNIDAVMTARERWNHYKTHLDRR